MRVGLVIYGSLETVSGGYLYDRALVERLRRQGDVVEVISSPWRSYPRRLLDNFSASLRQRLQNGHFDVLLQDELNHPSLFWLNQRIHPPCPILAVVHHLRSSELRPAWQNRAYRWIERRYLRSVDGFVFNSQATRRTVALADASLAEKPHLVAYPAGDQLAPEISAAEIARRAAEPGPLRLLFLGNLIPRKGLHTLLQALQQLPAGACRLSVVGSLRVDPAYVRAIRRQIQNAGLADRVRLFGSLPAEALSACLRSQHLLAIPSTYEGYGIAYLEGMGFGLPAIATTGGGASEIITQEVDGFLIQPGDAPALAGCLARLAQDRARLADMSLAARRRYLAQPTWEQTTGLIRSFLLAQARGTVRMERKNADP